MDDLSHAYQTRLAELRADVPEHFRTNDAVRVRSAVEILATLDMEGRSNNRAFLPEMVAMIGMTARVHRSGAKGSVQLDRLPGVWDEAWLAHKASDTAPAPAIELMARQRLLALATYNAAVMLTSAAGLHIPTPVEMTRIFVSAASGFWGRMSSVSSGGASRNAAERNPAAK